MNPQNMMFTSLRSTPSPHPQGFQAIDYATQMQMMLPGALYGHPGMNMNSNMFQRGRRAVYDANAANRSPLLDEFRSNKTRGWDLRVRLLILFFNAAADRPRIRTFLDMF